MLWLDGYLNHTELPWIPLSVRNYRPLRVAAFSLLPELRDIQEMMPEGGVDVSYEAIRLWCLKFGADYARRLRRQRGHLETRGISTRSSARSKAIWRICGARSIRAGRCSTCWCRSDGMMPGVAHHPGRGLNNRV
jgi:hypothetical protein